MPYSNKQMLRDANGDLIPQYWDVVEQDFKPLTGQGGANDVRLTGRNVELARSLGTEISAGSTAVVIDYTNVESVSKVYANVVSDIVSHNFDILIDYRFPQRSSGMPNVASLATTINITSDYRGKTGTLDVELFEVRVRIRNNHTDTRKYDVFLGGIR